MGRAGGRFVRRALREALGLYWESGVGDDVPALAWFLLSSLAPLALGLTALATVVLGDYAQAQALAARVAGVLPGDVHDRPSFSQDKQILFANIQSPGHVFAIQGPFTRQR